MKIHNNICDESDYDRTEYYRFYDLDKVSDTCVSPQSFVEVQEEEEPKPDEHDYRQGYTNHVIVI